MANNDVFKVYTATSDPAGGANHTVPEWSAKTGTYKTQGKYVLGQSNCLFLTECRVGDFLFSSANQQLKKITGIETDNLMFVEEAFTADVSSAESTKIVAYAGVNTIRVKASTGSTITINNAALTAGDTFEATNGFKRTGLPYVDPVACHIGGGTAEITIVY